MIFLRVALASLWTRRGSILLTLFAVMVSVYVMLSVEFLRQQARTSFGNTVSGIDLIVGPRTGDINLLLYSVFRLGNATHSMSWDSYQRIASSPDVAWTIPLSLGDSHRGYRVVGTTTDYFQHFRYGRSQPLAFTAGAPFADTLDVVLGSEVARALEYEVGDSLVLSHGIAATSFTLHDDNPFRVVGILAPTGTPVDQALHVSLAGIEAIHKDGRNKREASDLTPDSVTAVMVGLESALGTFRVQRRINQDSREALLAILPGVTLSQLWEIMSTMENVLRLISLLVILASLLGLAAMLLASIRERGREIAVFRAIGASPWTLLVLIEVEAIIVVLAAIVAAAGLLAVSALLFASVAASQFGVYLDSSQMVPALAPWLSLILGATFIVVLLPAISAYRKALQQQLA